MILRRDVQPHVWITNMVGKVLQPCYKIYAGRNFYSGERELRLYMINKALVCVMGRYKAEPEAVIGS